MVETIQQYNRKYKEKTP